MDNQGVSRGVRLSVSQNPPPTQPRTRRSGTPFVERPRRARHYNDKHTHEHTCATLVPRCATPQSSTFLTQLAADSSQPCTISLETSRCLVCVSSFVLLNYFLQLLCFYCLQDLQDLLLTVIYLKVSYENLRKCTADEKIQTAETFRNFFDILNFFYI